MTIANIAHAGDGNLHPLFVVPAGDDAARHRAQLAFDEIIAAAIALGGTVSGEHGIGLLKRAGLAAQVGPDVLALYAAVKRALDPAGIGIAYFMTTDGTFENSGVPTFARALIASYEDHEGDDVSRMLLTIARDEMNHDDICRRVAQTLVPGFPFDFEPKTELERIAQNNQRWISYTNSRYWRGYCAAFSTRRFPAITTAFILGEAAASVIFLRTSEQSQIPALASAFRLIATDESRHFAFCAYLAAKSFPTFTDEEKATMTKNLRASFLYLSAVLDVPQPPFWNVPDGFVDAHMELEHTAVLAGIGLPDVAERREIPPLCRVCVTPCVLPRIDLAEIHIEEYGGRTHAFCSQICRRVFFAAPDRYMQYQNFGERFHGWDLADVVVEMGLLRDDGKTLIGQPHFNLERMWTIDDIRRIGWEMKYPLAATGGRR